MVFKKKKDGVSSYLCMLLRRLKLHQSQPSPDIQSVCWKEHGSDVYRRKYSVKFLPEGRTSNYMLSSISDALNAGLNLGHK